VLPPSPKQLLPSLRIANDEMVIVALDDLRKSLPSLRLKGDEREIGGNVEVTLSQADFRRVLSIALSGVQFDEKWYLTQVPELRDDLKRGAFRSAAEHYYFHGYLEGRFPHKPKVDEKYYLETYPDIARAVQSGQVKSAYEHFVTDGYAEGRKPVPSAEGDKR
jgi:hypothetical protein